MREYRNPILINKMMVELKMSRELAEETFEDVKRFLALTTLEGSLAPSEKVDRAWHLFILFTHDYAAFCQEYIGHFVHHVPEDPFSDGKSDVTREPLLKAQTIFGLLSGNWLGLLARCGSDDKCRACTKCRGCQSKLGMTTHAQ
jgi:hypothetical protein